MGRSLNVSAVSGALTAQAFVGDGCVLLAFDLKEGATADFAGFAIRRTNPDGTSAYLHNFLNFTAHLTQDTSEADVHGAQTTTDVAPIQKYRWIDFPSDVNTGDFTYRIETRFFAPDAAHLKTIDTVTMRVTLGSREGTNFHVGFTRGYMASQAYALKFANDLAFRPADRTDYLFDSEPYEEKWAWLGYHARTMVFDFLQLARSADVASVDAFIYDVDEPDFVRGLIAIAQSKPLRIILDDSRENGRMKPDREGCVHALRASDQVTIKRTHFKRFAHDKVLILRGADGNATHVLCGSANFSIRGLYVQGNSVIVVDDAGVADTFAQAFDAAWTSVATFSSQPIATSWHTFRNKAELPEFGVSFAPHQDGEFALVAPERAVERAQKNVIFALMSPGGGKLIEDLKALASNAKVFTFGILQTEAFATQLMQGGGATVDGTIQNEISSFTALDKIVPEPFIKEYDGGLGQTIHHKFVVVDFNGTNPAVYCGSSNLTSGGEAANGDNLLGIYDRELATLYAIEGIRLADHYRFRDKLKTATDATPMTLQGPGADRPWYADYYVAGTAKYRSRKTLIQ